MLNSSNRNLNPLVDKLLDISRESGFTTEDIIKNAKIDLNKPIQEIDLPRIIDYAYNYTKDEALMIKLGQRVDVTYFGSFGFALMSCLEHPCTRLSTSTREKLRVAEMILKRLDM